MQVSHFSYHLMPTPSDYRIFLARTLTCLNYSRYASGTKKILRSSFQSPMRLASLVKFATAGHTLNLSMTWLSQSSYSAAKRLRPRFVHKIVLSPTSTSKLFANAGRFSKPRDCYKNSPCTTKPAIRCSPTLFCCLLGRNEDTLPLAQHHSHLLRLTHKSMATVHLYNIVL